MRLTFPNLLVLAKPHTKKTRIYDVEIGTKCVKLMQEYVSNENILLCLAQFDPRVRRSGTRPDRARDPEGIV